MEGQWDFRFGIVILGDSAVGKSSLLRRYTEGTYEDSNQSPLGIDFKVQQVSFDPGLTIQMLLWDTAGQERFRSISKSYMRNSVGCILLFDLTQQQTFERVRAWHREVVEYVRPAVMVFMLVGHKSDLVVHRRVRRMEAEALAKELDMATYVEVSSKDDVNVALVFETIAREIYEKYNKGMIPIIDDWHGLAVRAPVEKETPKPEKTGCCGFFL